MVNRVQLGYDDITDDFQIIEEEKEFVIMNNKFILTPLDYIILAIGARDYKYIMFDNRNIYDHEVTSIYPVYSYHTLSFIMFLLSLKFPIINSIFKFKPHRVYGVWSTVFHNIINSVYKKWPLPEHEYIQNARYNSPKYKINPRFKLYYNNNNNKKNITYNLSERPFTFLHLANKFTLLNNNLFNYKIFKNNNSNPFVELYYNNTQMLTRNSYPKKMKLSWKELERPFKDEVFLYLIRFYYNRYQEKFDYFKTKVYRSNEEYKISEFAGYKEFYGLDSTDRKKMNIDLNFHGGQMVMNIYNDFLKIWIEKFGLLAAEFPLKMDKIVEIIKNNREKPITSIDELNEFYIKSILIRRPPKSSINTPEHLTNGIYLLHNGVGRFREIVNMEILRNRILLLDDYIKISDRFVELRHLNKNNKRVKLSLYKHVVDMKNNQNLLNPKFMEIVDGMYKYFEVHHILKYAQIYMRLFNSIGNEAIWFILKNEYPQYTSRKQFTLYEKTVKKNGLDISKKRKKVAKLYLSFIEEEKNNDEYTT